MSINRATLIRKEDLFRIRRPRRAEAKRPTVLRKLPRLFFAIRLFDIQFVFAGRIGEIRDPLAVGAPGRIALGRAAGPCQIPRTPSLGRDGPDVAAGLEQGALTRRRNVPGGDELVCLDQPRSKLGPIAGDHDVHGPRFAACQVEKIKIGTELKDNFAFAELPRPDRRPFDIVLGKICHLLALAGFRVIRPDVESMVGRRVRQVVHDISVPHRQAVEPLPICDLL